MVMENPTTNCSYPRILTITLTAFAVMLGGICQAYAECQDDKGSCHEQQMECASPATADACVDKCKSDDDLIPPFPERFRDDSLDRTCTLIPPERGIHTGFFFVDDDVVEILAFISLVIIVLLGFAMALYLIFFFIERCVEGCRGIKQSSRMRVAKPDKKETTEGR